MLYLKSCCSSGIFLNRLKIFFVSFFLFVLNSEISGIDVSVNYARFQNEEKAYLEIYMHIFASTVTGFPENESGVSTLILFRQGDNIINFEKYKIHFPADSTQSNFVDLRRFGLQEGEYELEIEMVDLLDSTNHFFFKQTVQLFFDPSKFNQSDLLLMSSLQKGSEEHPLFKRGYLMEDVAFNYYYDDLKSLYFYNEVYNASSLSGEKYFYSYSICEQYAGENGKIIKQAHKRLDNRDIQFIIHEINIEDLPSGNYHLSVEIKNSNKEVLSERTKNFQRSNPIFDLSIASASETNYNYSFVHNIPVDELDYSLKAIVPRLNEESSEGLYYVIENGDEQSKRYYLFRFWKNINAENPEMAFRNYMEVAKAVDKSFFSGFGYGFETDRGRIFLKYGKPNDLISVEEEPSAPPYEIWFYNNVPETEQTNVKFLFYNPSLGHNDYKLLHSTCRGELNNPAWEVELYSKSPNERIGNTIDARNVQDNFNRNARRYFENN